jgi:hypothetical protein
MNQSDQPLPSVTPVANVETLQQQLDSLQTLTRAVLVAMLWLCAAAGLFLYRQVSMSNQQVSQQKQMIARFDSSYRIGLDKVVATLQAFSKTNQSFTAILIKHDLAPAGPTPSAPPYQGQK